MEVSLYIDILLSQTFTIKQEVGAGLPLVIL